MQYETGTFELPCGYLTEEGALYTHIEVREMTGNEEDMLTDKKRLFSGQFFNDLISSCGKLVRTPDDKPEYYKITKEVAKKMTMGDRLVALLSIRRVSYGDSYKFFINCPSCNKRNEYNLPLSSLEVIKMEKPTVREYDFDLPNCEQQTTLTFKISTGLEEFKMKKLVDKNPNIGPSANLAARLISVNGEPTNSVNFVKTLTVRQRNAFREEVKRVEGGVKTRLNLECDSCLSAVETELPIQENFFLPTSD